MDNIENSTAKKPEEIKSKGSFLNFLFIVCKNLIFEQNFVVLIIFGVLLSVSINLYQESRTNDQNPKQKDEINKENYTLSNEELRKLHPSILKEN